MTPGAQAAAAGARTTNCLANATHPQQQRVVAAAGLGGSAAVLAGFWTPRSFSTCARQGWTAGGRHSKPRLCAVGCWPAGAATPAHLAPVHLRLARQVHDTLRSGPRFSRPTWTARAACRAGRAPAPRRGLLAILGVLLAILAPGEMICCATIRLGGLACAAIADFNWERLGGPSRCSEAHTRSVCCHPAPLPHRPAASAGRLMRCRSPLVAFFLSPVQPRFN